MVEWAAGCVHSHEFFGMGNGELGEKNSIEQLKDAEVCADTESKSEQCGSGECRSAAKVA